MNDIRPIKKVLRSKPTIEGAGVHLRRAFGYRQMPQFDSFLLLDDFGSDDPTDYLAGSPWHLHRGIETITHALRGSVEHGDSLGNASVITSGDVQWMTAGSGIIHQEMPKARDDGVLWGLQLWANLPASHKMMDPRYRDVKRDEIPNVVLDGGVTVDIICGTVGGVAGPVRDIVTEPEYLDVTVPPATTFGHSVAVHRTVFACVIQGSGRFGPRQGLSARNADHTSGPDGSHARRIQPANVVAFGSGDTVEATAGDDAVRFLLISGRPIGKAVAWGGPIVMNTKDELRTAFREYREGTFFKHQARHGRFSQRSIS